MDNSTIRIKSAHKWPEPIVFDTSLPTIDPPPLAVLAKAPVINQPREALAQLNSPLPKASGGGLSSAPRGDARWLVMHLLGSFGLWYRTQ